MKKFILLSTTVLLTAAATIAVDWNSVENLAIGSTVVVSSNPGAAATITDNDNGSSWQATGGANKYANDWALIDLGESKTFNEIEIIWEASHPSDYSVYVSEEAIPYAPTEFNKGNEENPDIVTYNVIDADWLEAATPAATSVADHSDGFTDNISLAKARKGRYILVYATAYNSWATNYGSRIFELRVANIADRDAVAALKVSEATVVEGQSAEVTVVPVNPVGNEMEIDAVENLSLTCSEPDAVEITEADAGKYSVKGVLPGQYTLTATATVDGHEVTGSASFHVEYNWANVTNIATGKDVMGRLTEDVADDYEHTPSMAVDGDEETYYTFDGGWGGGDSWVIVDLGKEYVITAVATLYGDNSGGQYRYSFGSKDAVLPTETNFVWQHGNADEGWTWTESLPRTSNAMNSYILPEHLIARYVVVHDLDNPNGKPEVKEIFINGEEFTGHSVATTIEMTCDLNNIATDETVTLDAKVYDQFELLMTDAQVTYFADGVALEGNTYSPDTIGEVLLQAKAGDAIASYLLNVVAHADEKANVEAPTITVSDESATVNGKEVHFTTMGVSAVYTFDVPYNFSLLVFHWETAAASDYTVVATDVDGNESTILEVSDRDYSGHHEYDRVSKAPQQDSGVFRVATTANLNDVKSLTVTPTNRKHNEAWTTKLLAIDTYGTTGTISGVENVAAEADGNLPVDVYTISGVKVLSKVNAATALDNLPAGIYIVGNKKILKK